MDGFTLLALSFGLAMDATAVAAARGLSARRIERKHVALVALWFGGAQGLMPVFGAVLGSAVGPRLLAYHQWIAAIVLWAVGLKMLVEARSVSTSASAGGRDAFAPRTMFMLALATSLDALVVGVTLPMVGANIPLAALAIGLVTAALSALGLVAGKRFGAHLGQRLDALGGVVLLLLGLKVLLT